MDAVARLQQKIDSGEVTLEFDADRGYLGSLLKNLDIPASSQLLVFAKSSAQMSGISPSRPRAIYFNDEVYVGWVQEGALELAAVDPAAGPFFYTLTQEGTATPDLRAAHEQLRRLPRLLGRSGASHPAAAQVVRRAGSGGAGHSIGRARDHRPESIQRALGRVVRHRARMAGRCTWATRRSASRRAISRSIPEFIANVDLTPGANVTDLTGRFDTKRYLTPHSDIVALMALGHQTHVSNLIAVAIHKLAVALETDPKADTTSLAKELAEPIVRSMLFSGEALLDRSRGRHVGICRGVRQAGPARQAAADRCAISISGRDCCGIR